MTDITQQLWAISTEGATALYTTPLAWRIGYDSRSRLTDFVREGAETHFTYDANGNRLKSVDVVTSDMDLDGDYEESDFHIRTERLMDMDAGSNRLLGFGQTVTKTRNGKLRNTAVTPVTYTVDANGSLTSDGLRSFEYDGAGQLEKVRVGQGEEAASVTYLHNAFGQRVFKSEVQAEQTAPNQEALGVDFITWLKSRFNWLFQPQATTGVGTVYVYGDGPIPSYALLGEYDNGSAAAKGRTEYIWLPVEGGLPVPVGIFKNGRVFAIHSDHLATPRLMTDDTGAPVWQWPYSAFGDNKPSGVLKATPRPKAAITNQPVLLKATKPAHELNLRYPGQYYDAESGLNDNYFRQYNAKDGRYNQMDFIGLEGGFNRVTYVDANPSSHADSYGLHKGDKWYGFNNREFQRWFHRCWKQAGNPDADKQEIAEAYADWVSRGSPTGGKCDNAPPPPPPPAPDMCDDACKKSATIVIVGGTSYLIYRCLRMLPSLLPPFWPTIPANALVP